MIFKHKMILFAAGLLVGGCGLLVTPPDDYPPEEDVTTPAPPPAVTASMGVKMLAAKCKPAVIIRWEPTAASDVLYYKVYREYKNETDDIAATLRNVRSYYDADLEFPDTEPDNHTYYYYVTAFDSSGNESVPSPEDTITLVAPPILLYPAGVIGADDLLSQPFAWNVLFKTGKAFTVVIVTAESDTLLAADFSPGSYDEIYLRRSYAQLRNLSSIVAPTKLPPGEYYWWVILTLNESTGQTAHRTAVGTAGFTIQQ